MKGWDVVNEIKVLLANNCSVSGVARKLGIDRKTVRKYRDMEMDQIAEYRRARRRRKRGLSSYAKWIEERVEAMAEDGVINAQSIYEQLKPLGFQGSARSVRRFVRGYRKKHTKKRIYEPFETEAGHQAMVDFGEKRRVRIGQARSRVYFAAMILSYSRKKYTEWYDRPVDTQEFIRFHQRAFQNLGGIPAEVVYDQTKLAVLSELYGEVEFNQSFYSYATWCGFKPYICNKFDPETKGKVESAVRYIKRGFLPGRRFESLTDLEQQWRSWLENVGDAKVHETTGRPPLELWEEEKPHLQPLTKERFEPQAAYRTQQVYRDGFVKVLGNRYSVPSSHHGQLVKVRVTEEHVEVRTLDEEHLHSHGRAAGRGKRIKENEHYAKQYSVPTQELTQRVFDIFESREFEQQLKKKSNTLWSFGRRKSRICSL